MARLQCKRLSLYPWPCRQGTHVPLYNTSVALGQNATAPNQYHLGESSLTNPSWSELRKGLWKLGQGLGDMQEVWFGIQNKLQPGVRFYLTVLLTIAAANSLFILVSHLSFHSRREISRQSRMRAT